MACIEVTLTYRIDTIDVSDYDPDTVAETFRDEIQDNMIFIASADDENSSDMEWKADLWGSYEVRVID